MRITIEPDLPEEKEKAKAVTYEKVLQFALVCERVVVPSGHTAWKRHSSVYDVDTMRGMIQGLDLGIKRMDEEKRANGGA